MPGTAVSRRLFSDQDPSRWPAKQCQFVKDKEDAVEAAVSDEGDLVYLAHYVGSVYLRCMTCRVINPDEGHLIPSGHAQWNAWPSISLAEQWEAKHDYEALKQRFVALANNWREETGMLSSPSMKAQHPAYREIIALGNAVVPLILEELKHRPSQWFSALTEITGEDPVPEEMAGYVKKMADIWIQWGRKRGLTL